MLKFNSNPVTEHPEVPFADDGELEKLVGAFEAHSRPAHEEEAEGAAAYVVSVGQEREPAARAAQLAEILALVHHQGSRVVGQEIRHLTKLDPRTLVGKGTAKALADRAREHGASMLVLDAELTPSQTRNLEDAAGMAICDREAVILNVFLRHARTRRAKIQVEIAQLEYLRPRIRGVGLDMDQQTGATNKARGPGETASELMARKLDFRLEELRKALKKLETSARTQRQGRGDCRRIAVVGYTNAGKTSLMNALTKAELSARDMPFETLDTTSRCLTRHGGEVVISDTVGFIRRLPERLLASFESTLSEINEASLLLIVVDASDPEMRLHLETTLQVIEKLGAHELPRFYVFNKQDRLTAPLAAEDIAKFTLGHPWARLSSHDAEAVEALQTELISAVRQDEQEIDVFVPYAAKGALGSIYRDCRVVASDANEDGLSLRIRALPRALERVTASLGKGE